MSGPLETNTLSDDPHLWIRVKFKRHRLPRDYPPGIDPYVLLRHALKSIGRWHGYEVQEIRDVIEDGPTVAPAAPGGPPRPPDGSG
jgi:hypothetical protein